MAQRVGRGIALLFHDRGTRRGWVVSSTSRPHFTPGKDPVPILQEAGWAPGPVWTGGKSRLQWDSIPDRPDLVSRYTEWATRPTPRCPEGSRKLRFPYYVIMAQVCGKVVSLTHRPLLTPGNTPGTHFCWRMSQLQGHSAAGRIMSMKNSNDTIGNRTRDLPACGAVPQPTAPPRTP